MPIIGGLIRQAIILRVGGVLHVSVISDTKSMVQDIAYQDVFPVEEIQNALDAVYQRLLTQEIKD